MLLCARSLLCTCTHPIGLYKCPTTWPIPAYLPPTCSPPPGPRPHQASPLTTPHSASPPNLPTGQPGPSAPPGKPSHQAFQQRPSSVQTTARDPPTARLGAKRDYEVWTYDSDNSLSTQIQLGNEQGSFICVEYNRSDFNFAIVMTEFCSGDFAV